MDPTSPNTNPDPTSTQAIPPTVAPPAPPPVPAPAPVISADQDTPPSPFNDGLTTPQPAPQDPTQDPVVPPPPADLPPTITASDNSSKGSFPGGTKGIIASIAAFVILAAGLGAGVILVQQNQNIREKAAETQDGESTTPDEGGEWTNLCGGATYSCPADCRPTGDGRCYPHGQETAFRFKCSGRQTECRENEEPARVEPNSYGVFGTTQCGETTQVDVYSKNCRPNPGDPWGCGEGDTLGFIVWYGGDCTQTPPPTTPPTEPPGATATPTATPTAPPGTAQCLDVKAYTVSGDPTSWRSWTLLSADDLSKLAAGQTVYFTVSGSASGMDGTFDKAQFAVNGVARNEVTNIKPQPPLGEADRPTPDAIEIYDTYTIPQNVAKFAITARIHHSIAGWIGSIVTITND